MNNKKKMTILVLTSGLLMQSLPTISLAESKYKNDINRIEAKKSDLNKQTKDSKEKIDELIKQQKKILDELEKIDKVITTTKSEIKDKEQSVKVTKEEISKLQSQIKEIQIRIDQRQEILDERMRSLQKSGGNISYLDVIFGAESFGDLVQRINAVGTIMKADKDIMLEQKEDLETVDNKKNKIATKKDDLEKDLERLKKINKNLNKKVSDKNKLVVTLKKQQHDEEQDVLSLEEQEQLLEEQEKAMKALLNAPSKNNNNGGTSSANLPAVSSGNFTRPADGYISSGFGYRSFDNEMHPGIDIVKKGTVPIVAAANGVVIRAYKSSSYGNVVFMSHNVDGKVFTTVYAHMNSYNVSAGQTVSKGQQIGIMGNTGESFGQHLHFELHAGQWNQSKSNAVDPEKYINF